MPESAEPKHPPPRRRDSLDEMAKPLSKVVQEHEESKKPREYRFRPKRGSY